MTFRPRKIDLEKELLILHDARDLEDDVPGDRRSLPEVPTGMDYEDEREAHIQKAMQQQLAAAISAVKERVQREEIPIPHFVKLNVPRAVGSFARGSKYIRYQEKAWDEEGSKCFYDMDTDDLRWLAEHNKANAKADQVDELSFERIIDWLEKTTNTSEAVCPLELEASPVLLDSERALRAVYRYWQGKRTRIGKPLLEQFWKVPDYDDPDPTKAFRPRERTYARRNRKNDMAAYKKLFKIRNDFERARQLLDLIKKREKLKRDMLVLRQEILKQLLEEDKEGTKYPVILDLDPTEYQERTRLPKAAKGRSGRLGEDDMGEDESIAPLSSDDEEERVEVASDVESDDSYTTDDDAPLPAVITARGLTNYYNDPNAIVRMYNVDRRASLTQMKIGRRTYFGRRRVGRGGRIWFDREERPPDPREWPEAQTAREAVEITRLQRKVDPVDKYNSLLGRREYAHAGAEILAELESYLGHRSAPPTLPAPIASGVSFATAPQPPPPPAVQQLPLATVATASNVPTPGGIFAHFKSRAAEG